MCECLQVGTIVFDFGWLILYMEQKEWATPLGFPIVLVVLYKNQMKRAANISRVAPITSVILYEFQVERAANPSWFALLSSILKFMFLIS